MGRHLGRNKREDAPGRRQQEEGITQEVPGRKHLKGGIWKEASGRREASERKHLGGEIWKEASGKGYLGGACFAETTGTEPIGKIPCLRSLVWADLAEITWLRSLASWSVLGRLRGGFGRTQRWLWESSGGTLRELWGELWVLWRLQALFQLLWTCTKQKQSFGSCRICKKKMVGGRRKNTVPFLNLF